MIGRRRPLALVASAIVVIVTLAVVAWTWSAFSSTTSNSANSAAAGTVVLSDNDSGTAVFSMNAVKPGDTDAGCIKVTSTGSLASLVKLYGTTTGTGLDPYLTLTVTRGTVSSGSFDDCTGFTADTTNYAGLGAGVLYSGLLNAFPTSYASGIADPASASVPEVWTNGEVHAYKLTLVVNDTNSAQGLSATQTFTWEARNTTLYSQVILSDQPAGYWKLDETSGTSAAAAAGSATGTYSGGALLNQSTGVKDAGPAVGFRDSDDLMAAGDNFDFAGTVPFSVEFWVSPASLNGRDQFVVSKPGWGTGWQVQILKNADPTNPSRLSFQRLDSSGSGLRDSAISTTTPQVGQWYHVVGTYDGSNMRLYVNGTLEATTASTRATGDHPMPFSLSLTGAGNYFDGNLDEVAVYSTVLTQQQVTEHYNAGRR